jgi:hypothetical protein
MLTENPDWSTDASPSISVPFWIWALEVSTGSIMQIARNMLLKFSKVLFFILSIVTKSERLG